MICYNPIFCQDLAFKMLTYQINNIKKQHYFFSIYNKRQSGIEFFLLYASKSL